MKSLFRRITGVLCSICCAFGVITNINLVSANAAIETTVYGDVNNSGSVDVADVVILSRYLTGDYLTSNVNMKYADVDQNTVLDTDDAKIILKYIVHTITSLPYSESGSTFNYNSYTVPSDESRTYVEYDCASGIDSTYMLSPPSALTASNDTLRSGNIDDRVLDSSANAQCIVYLSFKGSDGVSYRGSGFIIDDHVIATCAHCLYDGTGFSTDFKVKVYNTAGTSVLATYYADELHIPYYYYFNQNSNYDYGLIYVDDDLSQYGKIALGLPTDNFKYTEQTVYISGFPASVNNSYTTYRYVGSGEILSTSNSYLLNSRAYVSGGDSGGPIYMDYTLSGDTFRSAIGICDYYGIDGDNIRFSGGVRMTLPVLRFFMTNSHIG